MKSQYETITSIQMYSLSPTKLPDLVTLADIGRGLYADVFSKEDPLLHNKTYGVIQNPQVRRRKGKRPLIPTAPASKFQPVKEQAKAVPSKTPAAPTTLKKEETASRPSSRDSTSTRDSKQPTLKRGASDLFKAFAKSKPPKLTDNSQSTNNEDTKMSDAPTPKLDDDDEGESEDEALFLDTGTRQPAKKRTSDIQKQREDKAAKLRKLMESDDDDVPAVPKVEDAAAKASRPIATDKADGDEEEEGVTWSDSENESKSKAKKEKEAPPEPSGPRRRRGKRKVMKKRTMKDEDGYLVTKEEPVWESFSESEPEAVEEKRPVVSALKSGAPGGGKSQASQSQSQSQSQKSAGGAGAKGGAKKGKGDIMSFFGKK
jgi:DNA polymerase subunit Cdc27